jgi:two-component system sensor kinase FixL
MVQERTQELRDAQAEVLRQQKLAALGQLAGGVAHELRNPLGSIKNSAYFLNIVLTDVEPETQQALTILEKEVVACSKIINSLLDFARVKLPERRAVQINTVLRAALSRVGVPDSVQVDYQVGEGLPTIMADHGQLELVFGNLILNAIHAMTLSSSVSTARLRLRQSSVEASPKSGSGDGVELPGGGRLLVTARVTSDAQWLAVSINDTGVGIPGENLAKLFEPFFSTKARGIGLGLALTKNLVEMHGGSVEAQSQLGQGSTFTVRLPLAPL